MRSWSFFLLVDTIRCCNNPSIGKNGTSTNEIIVTKLNWTLVRSLGFCGLRSTSNSLTNCGWRWSINWKQILLKAIYLLPQQMIAIHGKQLKVDFQIASYRGISFTTKRVLFDWKNALNAHNWHWHSAFIVFTPSFIIWKMPAIWSSNKLFQTIWRMFMLERTFIIFNVKIPNLQRVNFKFARIFRISPCIVMQYYLQSAFNCFF